MRHTIALLCYFCSPFILVSSFNLKIDFHQKKGFCLRLPYPCAPRRILLGMSFVDAQIANYAKLFCFKSCMVSEKSMLVY
jgi:hypothetical protein